MAAKQFLNLLMSLSLSGTLLFGLMILFYFMFRKTFTFRFCYFALMLLTVRFLIPYSIPINLVGIVWQFWQRTPLYIYLFGGEDNMLIKIGSNVQLRGELNNIHIGQSMPSYANLILFIWLVGFIVLLVQKITKYHSFLKYIKSGWHAAEEVSTLELLSEVCEEKKVTRIFDVYISPIISSPLLLGGFHPVIILPSEKLPTEQLRSIFQHEVTHYQ